MEKIGLIAGMDRFPLVFAQEVRDQGIGVIAVGIKGLTLPEIEEFVETIHWIGIGELGNLKKALLKEGITKAVMAGRIPRETIFADVELDEDTKDVLFLAKERGAQSLLHAVALKLQKDGIQLIDGRPLLPKMVPTKGSLTKRRPTEDEWKDVHFGKRMAKEIGRLDIGQTVVVKDRAVLAVEALEGTDEAIRRGAHLGKEGAVVVKMSSPHQDMRFDIPVIGLETLRILTDEKVSALAVEAGKTVILDKEDLVRRADEAHVSIVAI